MGQVQPVREDRRRDIIAFQSWLNRHGMKPSKETAFDAMVLVGQKNRFHPVQDYLKTVGSQWDGIPRLETELAGPDGRREDRLHYRSDEALDDFSRGPGDEAGLQSGHNGRSRRKAGSAKVVVARRSRRKSRTGSLKP